MWAKITAAISTNLEMNGEKAQNTFLGWFESKVQYILWHNLATIAVQNRICEILSKTTTVKLFSKATHFLSIEKQWAL